MSNVAQTTLEQTVRESVRSARESGMDPAELVDVFMSNLISVGIHADLEPEGVLWELRQRWGVARQLHARAIQVS